MKNLNNHPLTYVEAEREEEAGLTQNMNLWGQDMYAVEDTEGSDAEKLRRMAKQWKILRPMHGNTGKGSMSTA